MLKLITGLLAAACFVVLCSDVLAAAHDLQLRRSFSAETRDQVGLSEAVSIAEAHVEGRALDAKLVDGGARDEWDVEIAAPEGQMRVRVDAQNGAVIVAAQVPSAVR